MCRRDASGSTGRAAPDPREWDRYFDGVQVAEEFHESTRPSHIIPAFFVSLVPGTRLGPYDITAHIGAGGMGEVYRAIDTNLKRAVAIKVLPGAVASDQERLARFQREAEVLASLNHPNIAHVHGLEKSDGTTALVMELVEGPTLADRLAEGPLAIDEALPVARQIADALDAAHERGIVHRDLKPANIKLRGDGTVKVLDFGLAKAMEPVGVRAAATSQSPTITTPAMTQAGVLLGTAAYMSPEQAKGRPIDKRSDVWAFGCVLYEMLTAKRAFEGEDLSETLANVLKTQPDWAALPDRTPPAIRRLLRRSLEKDRGRRLADMGDARLEIEEAIPGSGHEHAGVAVLPNRLSAILWTVIFLLGSALLALLAMWRPWQERASLPSQRLTVQIGADASLRPGTGMPFAISPDGSMLAFVSEPRDGSRRLYLRRFGQLEADVLVANASGSLADPFFSPDGQWIGFFSVADRAIKKISIAGGTAVTVCDSPTNPSRGASWGDDGYIVFNPRAQDGPLLRVSSAGGTPEPISALREGEVAHRWPQMLPGGGSMLFTAVATFNGVDGARIVAQQLPAGPAKTVVEGAYYGRYVRSGHLLYIQGNTLFAVPFDVQRLETSGTPVAVVQGVRTLTESAASWFDVSESGTLVYVPGELTDNDARMLWLNRDGALKPLRAMPADWRNPQFSPDGKRLAFAVDDRGQSDVWVHELENGREWNLTLDPGQDTSPVWSPDGSSIAFASTRGDGQTLNLYWQSADGSGGAHRLIESSVEQRPTSWHTSGQYLAYHAAGEIAILPLENAGSGPKAGSPMPFVTRRGASSAVNGMFSPDGQWLAYQSQEGGRTEVFVRPFPGPGGGQWQLSTAGGRIPTWSRRLPELFFQSSDNRLMLVTYTIHGSAFRADPPQQWTSELIQSRPGHRWFDLHPDGDRFVVNAAESVEATPKLDAVVVITNVFDELRRSAARR
jgi:serine/threonine-protein kinase